MDLPLSDSAIRALIPNATVVIYSDLKNWTAEKLLSKLPVILLYETSPLFGHWVLLDATIEGIEFFDSLGYKPDQQFKFIDDGYRMISGQKRPLIAKILHSLSKIVPINYNDVELQGKNTNTCGRWCVIRHMSTQMGIKSFINTMKGISEVTGMNMDELVIWLTQ